MPTLQSNEGRENMKLRRHQLLSIEAAKEMAAGKVKTVLLNCIPGGGKSRVPLLFHEVLRPTFPQLKIGWVVPRASLRHQAALEARDKFGITLNDCGNETNPSRGTSGFVTTHQALVANPALWEHEFRKHDYLLVIDELHHATAEADDDDRRLAKALDRLRYKFRLGMTGTLARNDKLDIWSVQYMERDGMWVADGLSSADRYIQYTRSDALGENAVVPLEFFHTDGPVKWLDPTSGEEVDWEWLSEVDRQSEANALYTALTTEYAHQLLNACLDHWKANGQKMLVACINQREATKYHKQLRDSGREAYLAISDNDSASEDIKRFRSEGRNSILVTCQMAYEGLDVPPITHICSLTNIRSIPWNLQLFGRAWRKIPGKDRAYCFCPDDPKMNKIIGYIKADEEFGRKLTSDINISETRGRSEINGNRILPLSGAVHDIRRSALDGEPSSPIQDEFAAVVKKAGQSLDNPTFAAAWRALGVPAIQPAVGSTYGEERSDIRSKLSKECRSRDYKNEAPHGTTEKCVFQRFGMSVKDMSVEQLKEAYCYVTTLGA